MLVVKPEKIVDGTRCIKRKIIKELSIWSILSNIYPERISIFPYFVASTYFQYLNIELYT